MSRQVMRILAVWPLLAASTYGAPATADCGPSTWFDLDLTVAECPRLDPERFSVALDARGLDPRSVERLRAAGAAVRLRVLPLGDDLASIDLVPADVLIQSHNVLVEIAAARLDGLAIGELAVVFPAGSLTCGGAPVEREVAVAVPVQDASGAPVATAACFEPAGDAGSRPADWRVSVAPAYDDTGGKNGAVFDFEFARTWGRGFRVHPQRDAWSSHLWRLSLEGSGATHGVAFHDSLKGEFALGWQRSRVGAAARDGWLPAFWLGAYARGETTAGGDARDLVYGARFEALLGLRRLLGSDLAPGRRPFLSLAWERVEPDRVDPSPGEPTVLTESHDRLQGRLRWRFYPAPSVVVDADWRAHVLLDADTAAGLPRSHDRLDLTVAVAASSGGQFLPFLRYTRGRDAPAFEVVEEVLFGLMWDRLFRGERGRE